MNNDYLARAKTQIPDAKTLIVLAAKRARALAYGARPMVRSKEENFMDLALLEIAEGKLTATFDDGPIDDFQREIELAKQAAGTDIPNNR